MLSRSSAACSRPIPGTRWRGATRESRSHLSGHYDAAIRSFDKTIGISNRCTRAFFRKGIALSQLGNPEEALQSFNRALDLERKSPEVLFQKGLVLFQLRRYREAIGEYDKVLAINPDDPDAHYNRGLVAQGVE